ncbi:MAG: DUF819 family protein [Acidobacteriota bacterium]|jgi:uncharacterized membrane protein
MTPLVSPDDHWLLWAVLLATGAGALAAERTRWGRSFSGAVLAIGGGFLLSNVGVLPASAPAYDTVWGYLVPLAIPLLLVRADLRRIVKESGPMLVAFILGAAGTVAGTLVAFHLVPLGEDGFKLAGVFCATYIGGSINYVAVAQALGLSSPDLLAAGVAADNLVMTLYFLILFALPSLAWLRRRYPRRTGIEEAGDGATVEFQPATAAGMLAALAYAAAICGGGFALARIANVPGAGILGLTLLAVAAATLVPGRLATLGGADELGVVLMQVFFATIGAGAHVGTVVRVGLSLFVFAALILAVHLAVILLAGRLVRADLVELVVASNANMGGPATAAAMAAARGWKGLVIPAVLCGTLGYALATFIGVAVGTALR